MSSSVVALPVTAEGRAAGPPAPLTRDSRAARSPPVLAGGRRVAYLTFRTGEGSEVWVVDTANGEAAQLLPASRWTRSRLPDWFPVERPHRGGDEDGEALRYLSVASPARRGS